MKDFDTTPKPQFLLAMQNQSWTVAGALSELVDNSFGSGRGNATRVILTHDAKNGIVEILDNGQGMDELGRLFQLGNTIGRSPGDIGLYGSGGTMALLWLAREVDIWTLRDRRVSSDRVNWKRQISENRYPMISSEWRRASFNNTPEELLECGHGTLIRIHLQSERIGKQTLSQSNVTRDLAATYSPAFRMGRQLIWRTIGRNGGERVLVDGTPEFKDAHVFSGVVSLPNDIDLPFRGRIGLVDDLPQSKSVVSIGFGTRVIATTRDCFGSAESDEIYTGIGVCGYLDLGEGWQPFLSTTKNGINDSRAWDALMQHVFEEIRPMLKKAEDEKLDMILDDLAMQLTNVFDGEGQLEVTVANKGQPGIGPRHGSIVDSSGAHAQGSPYLSDVPGSEATGTVSAATKLVIWKESDATLEGSLCRLEESNGQFLILVNKDHPHVAQALKEKPVNRIALMFLINSEIAAAAARDELFRKRLFAKRAVLEKIDAVGEWPGSFICRLLMDRVRLAKPATSKA